MGGGKGGSDFDPKGKSDNEVMRFCQSFMTELQRHIGANTDVPAGDIGVGGREIGFMFGQYKRLRNEFTGVLTGKGLNWGGSLIRPEATGYGTVYFAQEQLANARRIVQGQDRRGLRLGQRGAVRGREGQRARRQVRHALRLQRHDPRPEAGSTPRSSRTSCELKNVKRGRIQEYATKYKCEYLEGKRPWGVKCDVALPCATQNEVSGDDAATLVKNGCICVAEGANMPTEPAGIEVFLKAKILYGPGKAANAGGVATSGLEMSQNSLRLSWTREEVDQRLHGIMKSIHATCVKYGKQPDGYINYVTGANIGGFIKVADSMLDQGVV